MIVLWQKTVDNDSNYNATYIVYTCVYRIRQAKLFTICANMPKCIIKLQNHNINNLTLKKISRKALTVRLHCSANPLRSEIKYNKKVPDPAFRIPRDTRSSNKGETSMSLEREVTSKLHLAKQ